MMSVADTVIIPMQDILSLGGISRMNRPGTDEGNWRWQMEKNQIDPSLICNLAAQTQIFRRARRENIAVPFFLERFSRKASRF